MINNKQIQQQTNTKIHPTSLDYYIVLWPSPLNPFKLSVLNPIQYYKHYIHQIILITYPNLNLSTLVVIILW